MTRLRISTENMKTERASVGVIYSPEDRQYFLSPGCGLTPRKSDAHIYDREYFRYNFGPRTKLKFIPAGRSKRRGK